MLLHLACSIAVVTPVAVAQGGAGCNNATRSVSIQAGASTPVTAECADISVMVMGFGISSPPSCVVAYTHYLETVWSCGPQLPGFNCDPQGSKAYHNNYSDGACPITDGVTDGMTWTYPWDIPDALAEIVWGLGEWCGGRRFWRGKVLKGFERLKVLKG